MIQAQRHLPVYTAAIARRAAVVACTLFVMACAHAADAPPRVTFKTLATYPVAAPEARVPDELSKLDGQTVKVTGYMLPTAYARGLAREFMLMRSQATCCFGQAAQANEFLVVTTAAPEGVPAVMDVPATFAGTLRISPVRSGGVVVQCYRIENARPL